MRHAPGIAGLQVGGDIGKGAALIAAALVAPIQDHAIGKVIGFDAGADAARFQGAQRQGGK